jgi:membrane protease YdiL (CAAX protease family)
MLPVFVRSPEGDPDSAPQLALPGDLCAAEGRLTATTLLAGDRDGPYRPVADALAASAALRDAFADACSLARVRRYGAARRWLFVGVVPLLMLAELDRELAAADVEGAGVRLASDLFVAGAVVADLARRLPRYPRATAAVLFGAAARFALFLAKACGHGIHATIAAAGVLAAGGAIAVLWLSPAPARVTRDILDALGIDPPVAAPGDRPSLGAIAAATLAALGLPVMLVLAQQQGIGIWPRALLYAGYVAIVPLAIESALFGQRRARPDWSWRAALAVVAASALTLGLTNGVHYAVDAAAYAARCMGDTAGTSTAARLLHAENVEVTRNVRQAREEWAFFAMNVAVVPLAEERVYRGLLQRVLAARWGRGRGIAVASIVFGLAHLGVYRIAVYQTVLLGVAFGVAFAEGGLVAAAVTHALWNLHLLL